MKFSKLVAAVPLVALAQALVIPHDVESLSALRQGVDSMLDEKHVAPMHTSEVAQQNLIEDSYIIVFKDDIDETAASEHHMWVNDVHDKSIQMMKRDSTQHAFLSGVSHGLENVFNIGEQFKGYAGKFTKDTLEAIRRHPAVAFVEPDSRVSINEADVETDAPWGLARVSHRERLSLGSFNKYLYNDEGGEGVTAYVIDTGTSPNHEDFEGRAKWGKTIPVGDEDEDGNGHGTHCSGTIAGKKYGVAKKANLVGVKVLRSNGSGSMSDVIKGVEYAAEQHLKDAKNKKNYKGATANMSLGGGKSPSLDIAVNAAVKAGIHFAVAAGNDNADACDYSPASAENAVTVGASTLSDDRAYFSNFGKCTDIFAPGLNIVSTYIGSNRAIATLSGTSMASPHICGLLTYFLSLQPSSDSEFATKGAVTPAQMKKNLIAFGTEDVLKDINSDTPNVLAYNGAGHNLTGFWEASRKQEEKESSKTEEDAFSILPIEQELKKDFENVAHDVGHIMDSIRAGFGLGF